ncbi:MAG: hypothetical protein WD689_04955 [Gaiellaceae bacterium]
MVFRLAAASVLALALAAPAHAATSAPTGLKGFLLRTDEPVTHVFPRTPSFAWNPIAGAKRYEFQLSTSSLFRDNGIVFSDSTLRTPAASLPMTLPWITGEPYSLYARVRAVLSVGVTPWSSRFGFNMRWPTLPASAPSYPGLLRWTPVEGARAYQVWFVDVPKVVTVHSNVIDERELYAFHQGAGWISSVRWRVRAVRWTAGGTANSLPAVSYGPWSGVYTSVNPPFAVGRLGLTASVSDTVATGAGGDPAHHLMPGFAFAGSQTLGFLSGELYRVYVFTDRDCVNVVFKGAAVGGPAYAPRPYGPLSLPTTPAELAEARVSFLGDGENEGTHWSVDLQGVTTTEAGSEEADTAAPDLGAAIDLWDTDWPRGGYYWTVVAVNPFVVEGRVEYAELESPQDACAAGRVMRFGKTSEPVLTTSGAPFASGLSPAGRLVSAATEVPRFYGTPLVAWKPVLGADVYEVQWSKSRYPFRPAAAGLVTGSTSAMLRVRPGLWWYRVRGINYSLPTGAQQMSWSELARLVVTEPSFRVETGR